MSNSGLKICRTIQIVLIDCIFFFSKGDVKKQWKSAMKKYHPPPEMHILPQSNHYINNNSQQKHVGNSIHGVLKKPPQYQVLCIETVVIISFTSGKGTVCHQTAHR